MDRIWGRQGTERNTSMYFMPRACRWTAARRPRVPGLDIENGELKRHLYLPGR